MSQDGFEGDTQEFSGFDPYGFQEQKLTDEQIRLNTKANQRLLNADFQWFLNDQAGRRILWWLLANAGTNRSCFHTTAMMMARLEGQRDQGLMLMSKVMEVDPSKYTLMLNEATEDDRNSK